MLDDISVRPYFIRAVYHWCVDKGHTPYLLVHWREETAPAAVPKRLARDEKIVFNISPTAARHLIIDDNDIFFTARFLGKTVEIKIPLTDVISIYAREKQSGISFPPVAAPPPAAADKSVHRRKRADIKMI